MNHLQSGQSQRGFDSLLIYLAFIFSSTILSVTRYVLQAIFSCKGAQALHDIIARKVILAPTSWFDATPLGRIVNRFSQDITTIVSLDSNLE